jgi:hypothetical protein
MWFQHSGLDASTCPPPSPSISFPFATHAFVPLDTNEVCLLRAQTHSVLRNALALGIETSSECSPQLDKSVMGAEIRLVVGETLEDAFEDVVDAAVLVERS